MYALAVHRVGFALLAMFSAEAVRGEPGAAQGRPAAATATNVPAWDRRGVGPLPWQGIACLDLGDDGSRVAIGTIASAGEPNVLVLNGQGKTAASFKVGQRWINQVAFGPGANEVFAVCTMPAGRAGDRPELFRLTGDQVTMENIPRDHDWFFHYGDHSNHATLLLARQGNLTAGLSGDEAFWQSSPARTSRFPLRPNALSVSLAVSSSGLAAVGAAVDARGPNPAANLFVLRPGEKKPVWIRPTNTATDKAPVLEKGLYGTPTLPDGTRAELPQRDEQVWAPLSVAVHSAPDSAKWRVAAADYQGWQRWVRSAATQREQDLGIRFVPSRPAITVYDQVGKVVRRFGPELFRQPFWCDLRFFADGKRLLVWPHSWTSRGLAGQPLLPADDQARDLYVLEIDTGTIVTATLPDAVSSVAMSDQGTIVVGCWDGRVRILSELDLERGRVAVVDVGGPSLVGISRDGRRIVAAQTGGVVRMLDAAGKELWKNDLNQSVPRAARPWVANARAVPLSPGVWQLPGGRVESDLGGQRLVQAPDGLILIEGHAGLSFDSEWQAIKSVGLDPRQVKYVLATHEHGDHAPGAYLWRVATGARFVCSREMAYTLQHHIPGNTGYGLHPPVPTDIRITRDTELDLAGLKVQAIRIPGHTYGSMAWRFEMGGKSYVAFGDLIMPKGVLGYSGSINFSASDVLSSLRKLQALKPDVVLPGHGAVGGPRDILGDGIDVGVAGGWGLIRPEKPDPRFRISQKNVVVAAWNLGAASMAFGDVDGDGLPDVAMVAPEGAGAVVNIFLNKKGRFTHDPDHVVPLPSLAKPHKIRVVVPHQKRNTDQAKPAHLFIAGQSAAILVPRGRIGKPSYHIESIPLADGNHLKFIGQGESRRTLITRRFGGIVSVQKEKGRISLPPFQPAINGPYVDVQEADVNGDGRPDLISSYGQIYLRGADGELPTKPTLQLPVDKGDWSFLAVGDFNADGRPDIVLLSYGMHGVTQAKVYRNQGQAARPFAARPDDVIALHSDKKPNSSLTLVRDTPVVADWNGDGIPDLVLAHGQSQEVLVLFGSKEGLQSRNRQTIALDYRVHYETGIFVGDFNGDNRPDLAVFGYTLTGVGWNGPPAAYVWLQ